jgi:hypothetical protein
LLFRMVSLFDWLKWRISVTSIELNQGVTKHCRPNIHHVCKLCCMNFVGYRVAY